MKRRDFIAALGASVAWPLAARAQSTVPVIDRSVKFDLVINLKTAKTLGLTVPDRLMVLADEVIE